MTDKPSVRDHPAFYEPSPVDNLVCQSRQDEPVLVPDDVLKNVGMRARASIAVFKKEGDEWVPENFDRTPWAVVRGKLRELVMNMYFARATTFTWPDIDGVSRTISTNSATGNGFQAVATPTWSLRWGTGITVPTASDFKLTLEQDLISGVAVVDYPNAINIYAGAEIYTGITATMREVGLSVDYDETSGTQRTFLIDHALTNPMIIQPSRLIAIQYEWVFL